MVRSFFTETIGIYWIIFNSLICLFVYQFIFKTWNYFNERNVKFYRGLPVIGSQYNTILGKQAFFDGFVKLYQMFPNEKIFGIYDMGGTPKYIVRDPEIIKRIAIKDFDHFTNHALDIHEESDPLFGRSLIVMKDQRWKDMRSTLSPTFTGSKMRLMFSLIAEVAQTFCEYLKTAGSLVEYDAKDLCSRFANDAIASCAFGLEVNSMKDKDNEFYINGNSLTSFQGMVLLKLLGYVALPKIMNFFHIPVLKSTDVEYFRKIILKTIEYREKNNIIRNDMINILIEAKKGLLNSVPPIDEKDLDSAGFATINNAGDSKLGKTITKWTDDELIAQSIGFFFAGFSTVSLTIAFAVHEIAVNPDVQEKLFQEIADVQEKINNQPLSYEILQKMKYLDMVICETMRKWPISPANDRQVTKPYILEASNGIKVKLNIGDNLWLPSAGLHMDPKYFPNPDIFDPERFSDTNKENIVSGTYMPFGIGPRSCIASRFALMESKAFLYYLITNFHLEKSLKTQVPLKLKKNTGNVEAENGFWVNLRLRT